MKNLRSLFDHLSWPQAFTVVALGAIVGLLIREILPLIPAEAWSRVDWTRLIALLVAGAVGTGGLALSGPMVRRPERVSSTPPAAPRSREEGSAHVDVLVFVMAMAAFVWAAFRAWVLPLLVAAGVAGCVSGCTSSDFAKALDVARPIVKWTCGISTTLCEKGDGAEACAAVAAFCGIVPPVLDAIPTSGGERVSTSDPHTIDGEDEQP